MYMIKNFVCARDIVCLGPCAGGIVIRKISVRELKPGMYVADLSDRPMLDARQVYTVPGYIRTRDEVLEIARQGYREVFVDLRAALSGGRRDAPGARTEAAGKRPDPTPDRAPDHALDQELERLPEPDPLRDAGQTFPDQDGEALRRGVALARKCYDQAIRVTAALFTAASQGRELPLDAAREVAEQALEPARDPAALLWAAHREQYGARLHVHSVNVFAVAMSFGTYLGLDRESLIQVGLAGLLHDVGQTRLPPELTVAPKNFSKAEQKVFARHCADGVRLLEPQGLPRAVLRAVLEHHERHDGQGYPQGLSGHERGLFGRILALADHLDALLGTGGRPLTMSPAQAVTLLYQSREQRHRTSDLERFIRFSGVYPPGTMVRLSDGRSGMVWRHDPATPLAPLVNVAFDARGRPAPSELVHLSSRGLHVTEGLKPFSQGVTPHRLGPY